ncbi:MAG TPA: hypothetical protein VGF99_10245 [Myxococcota bacterium]
MTIRFAITIICAAFVATMFCAREAHAETRAARGPAHERHDDDCDEMTMVASDLEAPVVAEVIVPCAMVDSGMLGSDCHDAAFYVVNQAGTLLCRLDTMVLSANVASSSIDDGQPGSASVHVATAHAGIATVVDLTLPDIAGFIDLPRAVGPLLIGPADDHASFSPRPS